MRQQERVDEIGIFGDDHTLFALGDGIDLRIACAIAMRKVQRMECIMSSVAEAVDHAPRKVGINQKLHAGSCSLSNQVHPFDLAEPGGERKRREHIVTLEILVVGEDLVNRHARAQQF